MIPRFAVMIPARYASSRFPGKPLAPLAGRAMILHACDQARRSGAEQVVVATDDARIGDVVAEAGAAQVVLTHGDHQSGTDRLAEVVERLGLPDEALVVNLQGDEPLMPPDYIRMVAQLLAETPDAKMSTLVVPARDPGEIVSPHVVKAVLDRNGYALYFSRAPVPWYRDGDGRPPGGAPGWYRHMGLYGYRAGFLRCYPGLDRPPMEHLEALEQLRALWHGHRIITAIVSRDGGPGIDTPADLQRAERLISGPADGKTF